MTTRATLALAARRPPFGGPQVVGYGYRWAMVAAAVTLTRTADGRRRALHRYPPLAPIPKRVAS